MRTVCSVGRCNLTTLPLSLSVVVVMVVTVVAVVRACAVLGDLVVVGRDAGVGCLGVGTCGGGLMLLRKCRLVRTGEELLEITAKGLFISTHIWREGSQSERKTYSRAQSASSYSRA